MRTSYYDMNGKTFFTKSCTLSCDDWRPAPFMNADEIEGVMEVERKTR
jgi:hypothetical protein